MSQHILKAYQDRLGSDQAELKSLNSRFQTISYGRLVMFLFGVLVTWFLFSVHTGLALGVGGLSLFLFLYLIQVHTELAEKRNYLMALIETREAEIRAFEGHYDQFDPGDEFVDSRHAFSFDMDFFGKASIFQYLNRTCSILGKHRLADWLKEPLTVGEKIRERQQAVQDLATRPDMSHRFQALGRGKLESAEEPESMLAWLKEPVYLIRQPLFQILMIVLPLLLFVSLIGWIASSWDSMAALRPVFSGRLPVLFIVANLLVVGTQLSKTNLQQAQVGKKSRTLSKYASLISVIETESFSTPRLIALQEALSQEGTTASKAIFKLATIMSYLDQRLNMVAGLLLNALVQWDLQCITRLEKWKMAHREKLGDWLEVISEVDAMNSLARLAYRSPDLVWPEVLDTPFQMQAVALGHLLIPAEKRICNDVKIGKPGEFLIITGANMAGKSTFLRTVGVNLVLAMSGAPVCAESYSFSPIPMMTSVRATDSLEDNESYFYAELLRLKSIIDRLKETGSLFIIVDEMLRGTNSHDKQTGSRQFIEQLMHYGGAGLIATHDLSLGTLMEEYPDLARNKRFEVDILEDRLEFDYKLKDGISQNLNATFLMRQMGIMP